jgi:hypothetical protein
MDRFAQLKEMDVKRIAPDLDANEFLKLYLTSNFPQTAAWPSADQKDLGVFPQSVEEDVNYKKKPLSGTSFDNPARS